ncbi:MAG: thioredoxin [Planctomycetales bacterium]|nr:thioredoxin [Planctomycetales bacterium]
MELREIDFEELVLDSERPVLVDFWASWCPPCKMMQPVMEKLSVKVSDWADVYSVNIDRNPNLASQYQISGVPTFVAFAGGEPIDRKTGALTENQLTALLKKALEAMPIEDAEDDQLECVSEDLEPSCDSGPNGPIQPLPVASATGLSQVQDESPEGAAQDAATMCRAFSPSKPFNIQPGPEDPGKGYVSPFGPESQESQATQSEGHRFITIVSGLPRSGTSLMMRMLNVGGIPVLCDEHRTPDADNPNGYYEFESVKSIQDYGDWIDRAIGHSVKMVYNLLEHLPKDRKYRVVFMRRQIDEIIQSQRAMLLRNGIKTEIPDEEIKELFERVLRQFYSWLPSQTHLKLINVSYNELLSRPASTIAQINRHLGYCLDTEAMAQVIDHSLYRNRAA